MPLEKKVFSLVHRVSQRKLLSFPQWRNCSIISRFIYSRFLFIHRNHQPVLAIRVHNWISAGLRMAHGGRWGQVLLYRNNGLQLSRLSLFHDYHHTRIHSSSLLWADLSCHSKAGKHVRQAVRVETRENHFLWGEGAKALGCRHWL